MTPKQPQRSERSQEFILVCGTPSECYTNLGPNQHLIHPVGQHTFVLYIIYVCQYHLQQVLFRGYTLQYREKKEMLILYSKR